MQQVWLWVVRSDGQVEQHVGPLEQWARGKDGQVLHDESGAPLRSTEYAEAVHKVLAGFHKQNAYDVASGISARELERDKTGALRRVVVALAEIGARVVQRQERAESAARVEAGGRALPGAPPLRAAWLADIELAQMTIHVRAE